MAKYDIKKVFADAVKQIHEFAAKHKEETFYAFAIDAGMLCLSSEEGFQKVVKEYRDRWQASNEKVMTREDLEEHEIEMYKMIFDSRPPSIVARSKVANLDEYIEQQIQRKNESRREALEEGNPYDKEEKAIELRYNTGDWPYQGFGDLNYQGSEAVYEEHYDMTDEEQENSEYSQFIKNLLNVFERNKDKVFAPLNCTADFKVINAKHDY